VPVLRPDQVEELKKVRTEMEERHARDHRER
jgi:hypothetical protein